MPNEPTRPVARAELRAWYLRRLRPRLTDAVTAGTVDPAALAALDVQLVELFDRPSLAEEAAA